VETGFSRDAVLGCVLKPIGAKALSYIALSPWLVLFLLGVAQRLCVLGGEIGFKTIPAKAVSYVGR